MIEMLEKDAKQISVQKARIISHCLFDGWLNIVKYKKTGKTQKHYIGYSNKNDVLLKQFADDVKSEYGIEKLTKWISRNEVVNIRFGSKEVLENLFGKTDIKKEDLDIPSAIMNNRLEIKIVFLKAFFDDEGRIDYSPELSRRAIKGKLTNTKIRKQIIQLLKDLGIESRDISEDVVITGKQNFEKFANLIGFTKGVKVIRKSRFSRWFGYEKNLLLKEMLLSYKV